MLRWIALVMLMGVMLGTAPALAGPDPNLPQRQQAFYKRLAADWLAKNAASIAGRFDDFVNLRLAGGQLKRYRKEQAGNVLRTYLRGITPVVKESRIKQWNLSTMSLLCIYWNSRGQKRSALVTFTVRDTGAAGFRIKTIAR